MHVYLFNMLHLVHHYTLGLGQASHGNVCMLILLDHCSVKTYLLVVDSYSKWPEIWEVSCTSATATIEVLRHIFSVFGLPEQLVSDNGPQFTSNEFAIFLHSNSIKHFKSAPYHSSTNGAVERLVQTLRNSLKKGKKEGHTSQYTL